jgi:hypothetical protein
MAEEARLFTVDRKGEGKRHSVTLTHKAVALVEEDPKAFVPHTRATKALAR